ncbi:LysR family transcriptional regulator [Pseudooceanicola sp. GBMRC 2024]|uniref:LysR family transcriptional regulator n=1 Tax=Pseudooceanicola albus TaxID=2692189 RepID=A0A6L7G2T9_9RHOB|nr:LysR family transcriptional regulator [Pseudooceanicola albus]MXN17777.1 LysR family transcriptional regulator [Pseudooceanicola albus]
MDVRFLDSLLSVVAEGSIIAAARAQGLTPAAVSQRIQALERELGVTLLDRRANRAEPTRIALDLLEDMRRIVLLSRQLKARAAPGEAVGKLRLGAISTMLTGLVPPLLKALGSRAPGITLEIEPGSSAQLFDALLEGRLDAALIVAPPGAAPERVELVPLRSEPLMLLVPPGAEDMPPDACFRRFPLIAYDPASWGGQIAARYLADHGLAPKVLCTLDGLEAISALVRSGAGASLVPHWPGLEEAQPLPGGGLYARRIVAALPRAPERPACQHALVDALTGVAG